MNYSTLQNTDESELYNLRTLGNLPADVHKEKYLKLAKADGMICDYWYNAKTDKWYFTYQSEDSLVMPTAKQKAWFELCKEEKRLILTEALLVEALNQYMKATSKLNPDMAIFYAHQERFAKEFVEIQLEKMKEEN